jgi:hypothetical protein
MATQTVQIRAMTRRVVWMLAAREEVENITIL